MEKFARFLVEKRIYIFAVMMLITIVSAVGMLYININEDMAEYLSDDSEMKRGLAIMNREFEADPVEPEAFKLMFRGLANNEEKEKIRERLSTYSGVDAVDYVVDDTAYNRGEYTLYLVHTKYTSTQSVNKVPQSEIFKRRATDD